MLQLIIWFTFWTINHVQTLFYEIYVHIPYLAEFVCTPASRHLIITVPLARIYSSLFCSQLQAALSCVTQDTSKLITRG